MDSSSNNNQQSSSGEKEIVFIRYIPAGKRCKTDTYIYAHRWGEVIALERSDYPKYDFKMSDLPSSKLEEVPSSKLNDASQSEVQSAQKGQNT